MKRLLLAAAMAAAFAAPAHAQRVVLALHFGIPLYWPAPPYYWYYPPPPSYYAPYYPPYAAAPAAPAAAYFFYCAGANAYYSYVRDCPSGWQRVPAEPPR